ncbi:MAG: PKD domain-containing protein [Ginsengibacter sp.]
MSAFTVSAKHIIGGEMIYEYLGKGTATNTNKYRITLKLFRDQNSPADAAAMPINVYIGLFDNDNLRQYPLPGSYFDVLKSNEQDVSVNPFPSCITNAPSLRYNTGLYVLIIDLPINAKGYTATYQTCCRISPLTNVNTFGGNGTGSTYTTTIPPLEDSSPQFKTSIDAICGGKPFTLDFSASDKDGDSLAYAFTNAFDGGSFQNASNGNPSPPPYSSVPYQSGYSGLSPLGNQASIDPKTGLISGTAPDIGRYVVAVIVKSYKNGVLINEHLKDFIVNVTNCDFAGAKLNPRPVFCDGFDVTFTNDDFSPLNKTFYWEFGDPSTGKLDTSTLASPTHIYSAPGKYTYKLVINRGDQCSDSATQILKIYPGFFPEFEVDGKCINSPIQFIDRSTTNYGSVNTWSWKFGDPSTLEDTAKIKNPSYVYKKAGKYDVELQVTSTMGCNKNIKKTVEIVEKPTFSVTNDTLICNIDDLQLNAQGNGIIVWTPNYNISDPNSFNPVVSPKTTTTYYATLFESPGCVAKDSVKVNVVDRVSLQTGKDTIICLTDTVRINTISNGLHYTWTPSNTLSDPKAKSPLASPSATTTYTVTAHIGKCSATDDITIRTVPYPNANAGGDATICASESYQLNVTGGSLYSWSPKIFLDNPNIPNPVTTPGESVQYIVEVRDVLGCPKPVFDTVFITVEKLVADAGPRDTSIVVNQPLQLNATGAETFTWSPSKGLNNANIGNPVALLSENQQYILKITSAAGCTAFDTIDVKVYKIKPGLYVPNAFTPDGDGLNDIFRPILVGMKSLTYFRVYNRGGQMVYSTSIQNQGWDGTFKGRPQDSGVFVWMVEGIDYLGNTIYEKGSVTLIR